VPLQQKIPIALDLNAEMQRAPEGEIPDLSEPFDERGAADDPALAAARDSLRESIEAPLTRAFRSSFVLSGIFALLASAAAIAFRHRRPA
jgi:hypothetical protein